MAAEPISIFSNEDTSFDQHISPQLGVAAEIASQLRATAAEREQADQQPFAEVDLLRKGGLLEALEPREFGGGGLAWPQALRIVREIAAGDTSIGRLLGYHYAISRFTLISGRPGQYEEVSRRYMRAMVLRRCGRSAGT